MAYRKAISAICLIALAGCVPLAPDTVARLGASPAWGGGSYTSGGGITVAADLRNQQGRTMVCGVWAQSRQQSILTKHVERKVLGTAAVSLGDETLARGLVFMPEVSPRADYAGAEAGCVITERPWRAGDETRQLAIRIPQQVVADESDENGTMIIEFKPTGPGAGL